MISKRELMSSLEMYILDHAEDVSNITKIEMQKIKKQFDSLWSQLEAEASEDIEEDE